MKNIENIQLVIPMSGKGFRFLNEGYTDPKPLIKVQDKPIIEHVIAMFPGVSDVLFICREEHILNTDMKNILRKISPKCNIVSLPDEKLLGPVDSVSRVFEYLDDTKEIIVSYCDYGSVWDFEEFIKENRLKNLDGSIVTYTGFHPHMLGTDNYAFIKKNDQQVVKVQEKKPFTDDRMSEEASNGAYYFKNSKIVKQYFRELMDSDIQVNGEFYVSEVYNLMIRDNMKVGTYKIDKMLQWGTPYDLEIFKDWCRYFESKKMNLITNPKNTSLILPFAGFGSRFKKEGYNVPKPFIKVDNDEMVLRAVSDLPICDKNIFIGLNSHLVEYDIDTKLKNKFKTYDLIGIDEVTEGQACTCEIGINNSEVDLEDPIMISACDNGVYYDTQKYLELVNDEEIDIIVWSFRNSQTSKVKPNSYAWLDVDENDYIKYVSCKKFIYDDPLKTHAIIGTMFFRKGKYFIDGLKQNYKLNSRVNNEFYVDDVLNRNIENGLKVKVFEVDHYVCWGTPDDLNTYNYWKEYFNKFKK